jgi:hypothetical protein
MPPLNAWPALLPLARHYSSRKRNNIDASTFLKTNLTPLGRDCCLIVYGFEKNYRENLITLREERGKKCDILFFANLSPSIS